RLRRAHEDSARVLAWADHQSAVRRGWGVSEEYVVGGALPDHLVRTQEQRSRHRHAERLRRLEIDPEQELGRLLDRKIGGFRAAQHLVEQAKKAPCMVRLI